MREVGDGIVEVVIGDEVIRCDTVAGTVSRRAVLGGTLAGAVVLALPAAAAAASAETPPAAPEPVLPASNPIGNRGTDPGPPIRKLYRIRWYETYNPDTGPVTFSYVGTGPGVSVSGTAIVGTTDYQFAPGWESGETVTFTVTASTSKQVVLSLTAS